eukprot:symbB.v1.2.020010.t3/scaffold1655.1/size107494/5
MLKEIQQLKAECRELSSKLEASELQRQRILREQQEVQEASKQTAVKSKEVQEQLGEQRFKSQKMQDEVVRGRHELAVLEKLVVSKQTELQHSKRWLAEERETALEGETRLREMVGKKTRYEEELNALSIQLEECRKEGCDLQSSFDETCREARMLQERLRAEEQRHRSELESAEASKAQKERLEAELKGAEGAKADAETELGDLRKLAAELAEHCSSQRRWRDEQLQKQASNELASERLRKEIQQLQAEQERLQEDAKLTMNKRNRLEVELQVAKPALDDARRRCKDLEGRLVLRVRELSDESERVRRLQQEADMAKARLVAMESQNIGGRKKLLDASPKTFGDFRCGELPARNSPRSPPALQSPPALLEPRLGDIRRLQDGYSGYHPHSPPSQILQAPQPLKEPRGDMSGARLNKSSPMGTLGNTTPSTPLPAPNSMDTDTVRFLCEYEICCRSHGGVMAMLRKEKTAAISQVHQLRVQQVEPDVQHFTAAIIGVAWTMALQMMYIMAELFVEVDLIACNAVLTACGRGQTWSHALHLLGQSLRPDVISFNAALVACPWPSALSAAMASKGCQPDTVTQNTEAASWVNGNGLLENSFREAAAWTDWSKALSFCAKTPICSSEKLLPCANAAMSACLAQETWISALEILRNLQRSRCTGDVITWGQCARSFEIASAWLKALELLDAAGPMYDEQTINSVIHSCAISKQFSRVFQLLKHGDARGLSMAITSASWRLTLALLATHASIRSRIDYTSAEFNAAVMVCKAQHWKSISMLLQQMTKFLLRLDRCTFHAAVDQPSIGSNVETWQFSLAKLKLMKQMSINDDMVTQGVKMSVLAKSHLWSKVLFFLKRLKTWQLLPDLVVLNSALSVCESSPQGWIKALHSLSNLADVVVQPDGMMCCAVMDACAEKNHGIHDGNHWIYGLQVYARMLHRQIRVDARSCNAALQCCDVGMAWSSAQSILNYMLAMSLVDDEIGVDTLLRCYKKAVDPWPLALLVYDSMCSWQNTGFTTRESRNQAIAACETASIPAMGQQVVGGLGEATEIEICSSFPQICREFFVVLRSVLLMVQKSG